MTDAPQERYYDYMLRRLREEDAKNPQTPSVRELAQEVRLLKQQLEQQQEIINSLVDKNSV